MGFLVVDVVTGWMVEFGQFLLTSSESFLSRLFVFPICCLLSILLLEIFNLQKFFKYLPGGIGYRCRKHHNLGLICHLRFYNPLDLLHRNTEGYRKIVRLYFEEFSIELSEEAVLGTILCLNPYSLKCTNY